MRKSVPVAVALGLLAWGLPALAQAPKEPAEEPAEEVEQPIVRRGPLGVQPYYRPGASWGGYGGYSYYVLDEDGVPVGRRHREDDGSSIGPQWMPGYGYGPGTDFASPQWGGAWTGWGTPWAGSGAGRGGWGDSWTGWGAAWNGWGAGWGGWPGRPHQGDSSRGVQAPRPR